MVHDVVQQQPEEKPPDQARRQPPEQRATWRNRRSSARHWAQLLICSKTSCACSGETSSSTARYNCTVAQAEGPYTLPIGSGGRSACFMTVSPAASHVPD